MGEEKQKPHRVSRKDHQSVSHWSQGAGRGKEPGVKCSRKRCRSWAAAAIDDCVALCCCPCAVVNLVTLAFVKVPWMIGRKCAGRGKKRRKKTIGEECFHHQHHEQKSEAVKGVNSGCFGGGDGDGDEEFDDHRFVVERDGSLTKEEEKTAAFREEEETRISARVEAERVWLELYQIGHLGFGRVSFTGFHQ